MNVPLYSSPDTFLAQNLRLLRSAGSVRSWLQTSNALEDLGENEDCDSDIAEKFLINFGIVGRVHCGSFLPVEDPESKELFRHAIFLKNGDGGNMVVSQPKIDRVSFKEAMEWAKRHGCTAEEFPEYSWHRSPHTTLLVFRRKKRNEWKIPEKISDTRF